MTVVGPCVAPAAAEGVLQGLLDYLDCQTQALGAGGYQALTAPGSSVAIVSNGLLVLFVAMLGYRMILGHVPGIRDGVLTMVKIGVVLTFAASWPAYQTLVYDIVLIAPAELAAEIGAPGGLPGTGSGLVQRLDEVDQAFLSLALIEQTVPAATAVIGPGVPPPTPFDGWGLAWARAIFLTSTAAALAAVRVVAGLLLALGPLFIAFLLFDGTRGLFEGWVRGIAGAALGALGTTIALSIELGLLSPRLAELIVQRAAGEAIPGAAVELMVISAVFALALIAILTVSARVAFGFRLSWWQAQSRPGVGATFPDERRFLTAVGTRGEAIDKSRPRAVVVAEAVVASQRREHAAATILNAAGPGSAPNRQSPVAAAGGRAPYVPSPVPLGQSFRRRTSSRVSAASGRRDAL